MTKPLREALLVFTAVTAVTALCYQLGRVIPFVSNNLAAFIAAAFLYAPVAMTWRRKEDLSVYGFTVHPPGRLIVFGLLVPIVIFPLFLIGFVGFYQFACQGNLLTRLVPRAFCASFHGWGALAHPHAPADFFTSALNQLVVTALPEELFFRGYLLKRLEEAFPPRRRWLGGGIGLALVISSLMFAVGHVVVGGNVMRLVVFFPGLLFGWMRSATGSIAPGVFVHASSNLFIETLQRTFFAT